MREVGVRAEERRRAKQEGEQAAPAAGVAAISVLPTMALIPSRLTSASLVHFRSFCPLWRALDGVPRAVLHRCAARRRSERTFCGGKLE